MGPQFSVFCSTGSNLWMDGNMFIITFVYENIIFSHLSGHSVSQEHPKFLPKVLTDFHLNQQLHLPIFFHNPHTSKAKALLHTLDVRCALAFYLQITKSLQSSPRCFISIGERIKSEPLSSQRLSRWISDCVRTCYEVAKMDLHASLRVHSIRAQEALSTLLTNVSVADICKAAIWGSIHTFMKHYSISETWRSDGVFGKAVTIYNFLRLQAPILITLVHWLGVTINGMCMDSHLKEKGKLLVQ